MRFLQLIMPMLSNYVKSGGGGGAQENGRWPHNNCLFLHFGRTICFCLRTHLHTKNPLHTHTKVHITHTHTHMGTIKDMYRLVDILMPRAQLYTYKCNDTTIIKQILRRFLKFPDVDFYLYQFNSISILYFNSHRAIQLFTVFQFIYVIHYFTENKFMFSSNYS